MSIPKPASSPLAPEGTEVADTPDLPYTPDTPETIKAYTLDDALLGTDPPIEKAHPGLQPVLVFASYPIALVILISIAAVYFAFSRPKPAAIDARPERSEVSK